MGSPCEGSDKKATVAVAHSLLIAAYHVLRDGVPFRDLGYHVTLQPKEAVA